MKVKYIGTYYKSAFDTGKAYDVLEESDGMYRIIDESEEDYWFFVDDFEIVER